MRLRCRRTRRTLRSPYIRAVLGMAGALLAAVPGVARGEEGIAPPLRPGHYEVSPAASPVRVDGHLDEAAWREATRIPLAYEWFPGDNAVPPVRTEGLLTYDATHLYAAFRAWDPEPEQIRAHLMDRDAVRSFVQDDHVTLMVDPFDDQRRAFQFRVNPLGVQLDALFSQVEMVEDVSWDVIWESSGRITDDGYVVEMAVPFDQLRFPVAEGPQTWRFQLGRSYPRSTRHRITSSPRDRDDSCLLCQLDRVAGFQGLRAGRDLEMTPTLTVVRTDLREAPAADLEAGEEELEPGLTVAWGPTPNLTVNATLNPDFSQVEADTARLQVNERFAIFLPERRPFFLEGVDLFATPMAAVFTRTVVDPAWGAKLTGKQGVHAGGAFLTEDDVTALLIPSNQASRSVLLREPVTVGVLRYRRDVGEASTFGVLYAGRQGDRYQNHTVGLDGFFRLAPTDELRVQYLHSTTDYPDELAASLGQERDRFGGGALRIDYTHVDRNWQWTATYDDLAPGFRADSGFIPRVDLRQGEASLIRRLWGAEDDWWVTANVGGRVLRAEDHDGRLTDQVLELTGDVTGPYQSLLALSLSSSRRVFGGVSYDDLQAAEGRFTIQPTHRSSLGLVLAGGDTVDFVNNQRAEFLAIGPTVDLKVGRHVNLQLTHNLRNLDVEGGRLSEERVSELRMTYNFDVRSLLRVILQHRSVDRAPQFYRQPVDPEVDALFSQLLFSYKLNPRSVLFVGYSDNRLGLAGMDPEQIDRTFFLKLGYAWAP